MLSNHFAAILLNKESIGVVEVNINFYVFTRCRLLYLHVIGYAQQGEYYYLFLIAEGSLFINIGDGW